MKTTTPSRREDVKDPIGRAGWPQEKGRDGERTPMQWSGAKNAGFSTASKTWLPVPREYKQFNVTDEEKNPNSILSFYKAMLRLRKDNAELRDGDYHDVSKGNNNVLAFLRSSPKVGAVLVALNYTSSPQTVNFSEQGKGAKTLLSTFANPGQVEELGHLALPAFGVFIGRVQ